MSERLAPVFGFLEVLGAELNLGVVAVDRRGTVTVFNYFAGSVAKIRPQEVLGRPAEAVLPWTNLTAVLRTGEPRYNQCVEVNGYRLRVSEVPLRAGPAVVGAVGLWEDRSGEAELSARLAEALRQVQLMDTIMDVAFEYIGVVDREGRVIYASEGSARRLGLDRRAMLGRRMREVRGDCLMETVARTGVPQLGRIWRAAGKATPVMVLPIVENGVVTGAICKSIFASLEEAREFMDRLRLHQVAAAGRDPGRAEEGAADPFATIVGESEEIRKSKELARRAAATDATVLLLGESGTGKELFARAIHQASRRSGKPFVRVNCAGIPEALRESELFGYEEGAFTGARKGGKPGKFELANGGTIFLDEIGDMKLSMQAKLLRVLQEGEIEKVGSTRSHRVDVRVIAATNRNLYERVQQGEFREDLYYRLDVVTLEIPPLRRRREDIPLIAEHYVELLAHKMAREVPQLDPEVLALFQAYPWPGNVRELVNVLEAGLCFCPGPTLRVEHLPPHFLARARHAAPGRRGGARAASPPGCDAAAGPRRLGRLLHDTEFVALQEALEMAKGNKKRAAALLGISRSSFYNKLRRYGLPPGNPPGS
ncbi:MAG: sigma 54-interacting transcriptional regulator [Firmicutes bacterium]|nr:sigma 54-interacting transcriptional regulator [Bacillota bacterium]